MTLWVVDRVEGDRIVLISDTDETAEVARGDLRFAVREGMVLRVPDTDWSCAERDPAEERRRLDEGKARLDRLRKRDPGGDVAL